MRIGIFGGSFNPIHVGHISLARQLRRIAGLDEVWLMVSPQNRLALHGEEGIVASNYELHLPKPSYTWNTLQHLHQDFPQHTFLLLIGGDNWALFPRWYKAQEIMDGHDIIVYPRRGSQIDRTALPPRVTIADTELLDISSTDIRQGIKQGSNISHMVPSVIIPLVSKLYSDCE